MKISPVDPEIVLLKGLFLRRQKINASKTYSPRGMHAARAKQVSKVIWQKAALPTCHPSQLRMDSSDVDPIKLIVPWTHMNHPPNGILIGSAVFARLTKVNNRLKDTQTD